MFRLKEFQDHPRRISDMLPWALLVTPSVLQHKTGVLSRILKYRGADLESVTAQTLDLLTVRLNQAMQGLGEGFALHVEAYRHEVEPPPSLSWKHPVAGMVDEIRRENFSDAASLFETDYYMTFTYVPARAPKKSGGIFDLFGGLFTGGVQDQTPQAQRDREALDRLIQKTEQFVPLLSQFLPSVRFLEADALLTYLHQTCSTKRHPVTMPPVPMYLDELLSDTPLMAGTELYLGSKKLHVISVKGYPNATRAGLLSGLDRLGFGYRWVSRFLGLSYQEATSELAKYERQLFGQQGRMVNMMTNTQGPQNRATMAAADSVGASLQAVEEERFMMGYHSLMIVLEDEDAERLKARAVLVHEVLNKAGLVTLDETANILPAWLSSLPGHVYPNARRALINSLNLGHMLPLQASWSGEAVSTHLGHAAHVYAVTQGSTPFRLNLNVGDVGHTMVLGPTGSGKSVLLGLLELQWLKYPNAQVIIFDKGRSSRATTLAVGGQFVELSLEQNKTAFQPLGRLDNKLELNQAQVWLEELFVLEKVELTQEKRQRIQEALLALAALPRERRTLTAFSLMLQETTLKNALKPYVHGKQGTFAGLWDHDHEQIATGDWVTFEMHQLMESEPKVVALTLRYLFMRLADRFDGRPTLLVLDEAWVFLDNPLFAPRIRQWLKELRKSQVYVVFASQELADALNSPLAPTLLQSCQTRILLPNPQAGQTRASYEQLGLNERQIDLIRYARPKRDYYFVNPEGARLFELGLSPLELALIGASTPQDHKLIDHVEQQRVPFAPAYLRAKGFSSYAQILEGKR